MNKFLKYIFVFLVVFLTACGGGDGGDYRCIIHCGKSFR